MSGAVGKGTQFKTHIVSGIDAAAMVPYLEQSGDDNLLHRDPHLAAQIGLQAIPVPGQLVVAIIERYLDTVLPEGDLGRLTVQFVTPVLVNRALTLSARVVVEGDDGRSAIIRIQVFQDERLAVVGEATVRQQTVASSLDNQT